MAKSYNSASQNLAQTIFARFLTGSWSLPAPKRLRIYCRYDYSLLGALARAVWLTLAEIKSRIAVPGSLQFENGKAKYWITGWSPKAILQFGYLPLIPAP